MSAVTQFRGVAPWRQGDWDWRATGNFLGGGTGTGILVAAVLLGVQPVWAAALMGLAFIGAGLTCVWLEIGKPWRAMNVLFNPRKSWMSREAFMAMPLFTSGLAAAWFDSAALLVATALVAVGFLYCQGRILTAAKGIPAWRQPQIVPLILSTGLAEGAGVLLAAWALIGGVPVIAAAGLLLLLLAGRAWALSAYAARVGGGTVPRRAAQVVRGVLVPVLWGGHGLPALLALVALALPGYGALLLALAGLAAAVAGWAVKATIILRAAYTQGYAVPCTPSRGAGRPGPGAAPGW